MKTPFLIIVSVFLSLAINAQNSVELKLNPEKNKVYKFKSVSDQSIAQNINGMDINTKVISTSVYSLKVVDLKPEFMVAEMRIESYETNTNSMGKNVIMSSSNEGNFKSSDATDVTTYFMNQMTKSPLFVKMDYAGKIVEIVNLKIYSEMVLKNIDSVNVEGPMGAMAPQQIKSLVDEKTLKVMFESSTSFLPGKKVSIGDKWQTNSEMMSSGMGFKIESTHKLESISNGMATISSEANVLPASSAPIEMMGAKVDISNLKGLNKSTIIVDIKTGLMKENNAKTTMSGNLNIDAGGQSMVMTMQVNGDSKVMLVD